jgi:hypothetical protein
VSPPVKNANTPAALPELAGLYSESLDSERGADCALAAALVPRMLGGQKIAFDEFYTAGPDGEHTRVPSQAALRALLVKLLGDIGRPEVARYIDHPEQGAKNIGKLVEQAIDKSKRDIVCVLESNSGPFGSRLPRAAESYSPALVFQVLLDRANSIPGFDLQRIQQFACENKLESEFIELRDALRARELESKLEALELAPSTELVQKALELGGTPARLRRLARSMYLKDLERGHDGFAVESAFVGVGFRPASIGKAALGRAAESSRRNETRDAQERLASAVDALVARGPLYTDQEVTLAIETLRKARDAGAMSDAQLANRALSLWLSAEAHWYLGAEAAASRLKTVAHVFAGSACIEEADERVPELREKTWKTALEEAIRDPWKAVMETELKERWLYKLRGPRYDSVTGDRITPDPRRVNAIVRFWNRVAHDPQIAPPARATWLKYLHGELPEFADMIGAPLHFLGEVELGALLASSPFAASEEWRRFTTATLAKLPPEVGRATARWTTEGLGLSQQTQQVFAAELSRLLATVP